jgi:sensor histidine kinase regulating citrate/malate metabolism
LVARNIRTRITIIIIVVVVIVIVVVVETVQSSSSSFVADSVAKQQIRDKMAASSVGC